METKNIYKMDLVLIVGTILILIVLVGFVRPLVIAPADNLETNQNSILFSIEKADKLLIDDNMDFTTPEEYNLKDGIKINLKPGIYYWKAIGSVGLKTEIRTITINSEIDLSLRKIDSGYEVINAGNVNLNVDVYNGTTKIDTFKVGFNDSLVSSGNATKFEGSEE